MINEEGAVMVCGSRSVPAGEGRRIGSVVKELLADGRFLVAGCATGADALVLSAALAARAVSRVRVFAAFGPGGAGACRWSAVDVVSRFAAAGGSVIWWAGGGLHVPLAMRLALRTRALVASASALVVFFASPASRGSLLACRCATRSGLPIVAFPLGFAAALLPPPGPGVWQPVAGAGIWSGAWRWVPREVRPPRGA